MSAHPFLRLWILFALLATAGCARAQSSPTPDATARVLIQRFSQTVTAAAGQTDPAAASLGEMSQQATATYEALQATRAAAGQVDQAEVQATAAAFAPLKAELPLYQVDPGKGRVGWIQPQAEVQLDGYRQVGYAGDFAPVSAKDFVIAADILWDSQYGGSGCGFVLRANGDSEQPSEYVVAALRRANGHVYFLAQVEGKFANYDSLYVGGIDPKFDANNGATNRLVVVGRGSRLTVYSNYSLVGVFDASQPPTRPHLPQQPVKPQGQAGERVYEAALVRYEAALQDYQETLATVKESYAAALKNFDPEKILTEGFAGLVGLSSSGRLNCKFSNAWLWVIEE
jgi:hypothetical protein